MNLRQLLLLVPAALLLGACGTSSSNAGSKTPAAALGGASGTVRPTTTAPKAKPGGTGDTGASKKDGTTTTSPGATVGTTAAPPPPAAGDVTFVGDSVGVDCSPFLSQDISGVHLYAMVDRSWGEGEQILAGLASSNELTPVVVVELGLNGPIEDSDFQAMMSILGGVKRVVFLNIRLPIDTYGPGTDWWQNQNNTVLATEIPKYPNAVLANWYAYSAGHTDWFAPDHLHLSPTGGAAMAELIRQNV